MVWIYILTGIIIITILLAVSVAPGRITPLQRQTADVFRGLNCAHRGLYTKDQAIPENSLAAFSAARGAGYGAELDVHLTADGQAIVFHDYDLSRVCGADKKIADLSYDEISRFRLFDTDEQIPLLTQVLDVLEDTPVIIELKPAGSKNALLCQKVLEILRSNGQHFCIQSFDPRICAWFKKNAPDVLRGQLSCPPGGFVGISKVSSVILGNLLLNCISRPHYIAYKTDPYALIAKICKIMKPMKATWTVSAKHDIPKLEQENDFIIFEHYTPAVRFK